MKLPLAFLLVLSSCSAGRPAPESGWPATPIPANSPTESAPQVEANWKERMAQPYVFVEHTGDYRKLGDAMRALLTLCAETEVERVGAPFALFFDDPGHVALAQLRARACLPVKESPGKLGRLKFDVLPRAMVVYARVPGAYPQVARSYPALFSYLRDMGWQAGGPIREVYLVNPADAVSYEELETEVQIPWGAPGQSSN